MKLLYRYILSAALFCFSLTSHSQNIEAGLGLGISGYNGDFLPEVSQFTKTIYGAGQLSALIHFNERLGTQFFLSLGRVGADDKDFGREDRNLSFITNITELGGRAIFNVIPFDPYGEYGRKFTFYIGAGVSAYKFNPYTTNHQGQKVFLQEVGTAGQYLPDEMSTSKPYSLFGVGIPVTGGIKWAVTPQLILGLEIDYRHIFTDYIDDFGRDRYPAFDDLALSNDQAALLIDRGWEVSYDPNSNISPIDAAKQSYENMELEGLLRSSGSYDDSFGFIFLKVSYILEDLSFGFGKSRFGCYQF
ncbi:DUF6089 family protein [Membranihabitans maritimus]|uniref:DUF6089 family protein n=1 Tax=Membranihabitans maritimus TaxID=2904244 RepID=UPI001F396FD7|nr:hypothetical protein [Membranihabitans maritimus]